MTADAADSTGLLENGQCGECGRACTPDAGGDGVGALVQAAVVQLHAAVVQVDAVDELVVLLVLLRPSTNTQQISQADKVV